MTDDLICDILRARDFRPVTNLLRGELLQWGQTHVGSLDVLKTDDKSSRDSISTARTTEDGAQIAGEGGRKSTAESGKMKSIGAFLDQDSRVEQWFSRLNGTVTQLQDDDRLEQAPAFSIILKDITLL